MASSPGNLTTGDEVEVICDEAGFNGAIYEARIVRSMPKSHRFSVEYETLVDDSDPSKKLRETVDAAQVRTRPPPLAASRFEVRQMVDAFYNDGWWTGEISKVLEGGRRYEVTFSGFDEELEFGIDEIRVHMEWIDKEWVVPQVQERLAGSHAQNLCGNPSNTLHHLLHAINSAHKLKTPVLSSTPSGGSDENSCMSEYSAPNINIQNSDEHVQLDSSQPCKKSKIAEATQDYLQLDYLLFARSIKTGQEDGFEVATPAIEERDNLHLQPIIENQYCSTTTIKEGTLLGINNEQIIHHAPPCTNEPSIMEEDESTRLGDMRSLNLPKAAKFNQAINHFPEINSQQLKKKGPRQYVASDNGMKKRGRPKKRRITNTVVVNKGMKNLEERDDVVVRNKVRITDTNASEEGTKSKKWEWMGVSRESERTSDEVDTSYLVDFSVSHGISCQVDGNMGESSLKVQRENGKQDPKEVNEPTDGVKCTSQVDTTAQELSEIAVDSNTKVVEIEISKSSNGGNCTSQVDIEALELSDVVLDINSMMVENEMCAQPREDHKEATYEALLLSRYQIAEATDMEDRTVAECKLHGEEPQHNEADVAAERTEVEDRRISTDYTSIEHPSKKSNVPFPKISDIWELIESSEVFSSMPQQPHFFPLEQFAEELREGMAIGLMVTFANLVKNIKKLWIIDSDDTIEKKMSTLVHLEGHGFNVQHMRTLLEELQRIKGNQKQLLDERSALEGLISERRKKKDDLDAKFEETDRIVMELERFLKHFNDKKASIFKEREDNDHELVKLLDDMRVVQVSCMAAEHDFVGALNFAEKSFTNTG